MAEKSEKLKVLEGILGRFEISDFSIKLIESSNADENSIKEVYKLLKSYGVSDEKIAANIGLLGSDPEIIKENYQLLRELGWSDKMIATYPQLLGFL